LTGYTGEHFRGRLEGRVDLAAQFGEVERERARAGILPGQQLVRVESIAPLGRAPAGRCMRMREQASSLQLRELVAHCRRRDVQIGALDQVPRTDGLAGGDVL